MKISATFFLLALVASQAYGQTIQNIATGAGYQKQSYVNLAAGTEKQVNNGAWDIAFSVFSQETAGVFVNESSGTSMGNPLPQVELYDGLTDNFEDEQDPAFLVDFRLYNSEKSWSEGGFNERRDTLDPTDYGWGYYDASSNQVTGSQVFVVKLVNGQYRKIKIESLIGGVYTFKYANLDGTGLQTKTINKADYPGKTLAYFNLSTSSAVDVEPATGGFDLLYCRYTTQLFNPGTMEYVPYDVTGILSGRGVQTAEADGVNPATVAYADYQDQLQPVLDVIGYDWKSFSGTAWSLDADRVFFLKTADSRVWKIHFVGFEGSTTGKTVLEKTDLGVFSAVKDPASLGMTALVYPNPVQDVLAIALEVPAKLARDGQLEVVDIQGRVVMRRAVVLQEGFQVFQLQATTWTPGAHELRLLLPDQEINLGKVLKQ